MNVVENRTIRTKKQSHCCLCGSEGKLIHHSLDDKLFGAPDRWDLKKCQNTDCGLVWLDPMPLIEELPKLYMNYYTHIDPLRSDSRLRNLYQKAIDAYLSMRYGYSMPGYPVPGKINWPGMLFYLHPERRAAIDCSIMALACQKDEEQKGNYLLEVGFGDGARLQSLASLGWSVEGVDFDPAAVENARAKGLTVSQGDIFSQNYADNSFDVLVSSHVIEHVPDPIAFFQECYRILKVGGKMVHYTPHVDSFGHWKYQSHWRGLEPPRHLHLFSLASLSRAVSQQGFTTVQCDTTGRGANILLDSHYLKQYSSSDPDKAGQDKTGLGKRLLFESFSLLSFLLRKINKKWGEELVVRAIK